MTFPEMLPRFLKRSLWTAASTVVLLGALYAVWAMVEASHQTPLRLELLHRGESCGTYDLVHIGRGGNRWVANLDQAAPSCPAT